MVRERLRGLTGLLLAYTLAGCGAPALTPLGQAGFSPPAMTAVDAGTPPAPVDAAGPPMTVDAAGRPAPVDAAVPPMTVDAGAGLRAVVRLASTTLLTGYDVSTAVVLAADGDGIDWVNRSNQLWMLPTGSDVPRELAADPNLPGLGFTPGVLVASANDPFWTADVEVPVGPNPRPLHRTRKTGGDVVLFSDFPCLPGQVAADDAYLYYSAYPWTSPSGAEVVALPLDADPGTAPSTLAELTDIDNDVSSLAVDDQRLYWTSWPVSTKVDPSQGRLFIADKASLLSGTATRSPGLRRRFLGRAALRRGGVLRRVAGAGLFPGRSIRFERRRSEPTAPRGDGPPHPRRLGADVRARGDTPARADLCRRRRPAGGLPQRPRRDRRRGGGRAGDRPAGLVFVDGSGRLQAVSTQDLHTAWQAGQQP